jgi:outer membrane protein assembly factor BamB
MKIPLLAMLLIGCSAFLIHAADWPTYLNDNGRVGATTDQLPGELELKWVYSTPAPPQLAFSGPRSEPIEGKVMRHRVAFDRAIQVAVVNGRLYFGSSVDNKIYCVDAKSGETVWSVFTDGAIRLAPTVASGKVYVGSDDGHVYCLNTKDGSEIWRIRAGRADERLLARGEMISRWPIRTGVLVDDGVAFFGAGVFPHETVYLYAVNAETGEILWKNDHVSEEDAGRNPLSPQGYLLASEELLIVPSGRSLPAAFDRQTGEEIHHKSYSWRSTAGGVVGGSKAVLADGQIYSAGPHHFLALNQKTGAVGFAYISGRQLTMAGDRGYVATGEKLVAMNRLEHAKATVKRQELNLKQYSLRRKRREMDPKEYEQQNAELDRQIGELSEVGTLWSVDASLDSSLALTANAVVAGGPGKVASHRVDSGKLIWQTDVEGDVQGLAISDSRLYVSTDAGKIYAFAAPSAPPQVEKVARYPAEYAENPFEADELTATYEAAAEAILEQTGVKRGFCLVVGSERGRLAYELARRSELQVYGIEPDAQKVADSRARLDRAGYYGHRVTIVQGDPGQMPFANYFANLLVSDTLLLTGELPGRASEIARRVKPCRGVVCLGAPPNSPAAKKGLNAKQAAEMLAQLNLVSSDDIRGNDSFAMLTRGKLPGAGEWSHQYGDAGNTSMSADYRVKGGMHVLWYGDPGPAPMINRHEAAAAPLSTNGRMFIQGVDSILCYDAYNGVFQWEYKNPGAIRTGVFNNEETSNLAASDDSFFVAVKDTCTELDAETGEVRRVHKAPQSKDGIPRVWGYVAHWNGLLLGTSTIRKDVEASLRRRGHTVENTTNALFAIDLKTGEHKWPLYRGKNVMHVTIAIGDDRIFFVDSSISPQQREEVLRQPKEELKELGPEEAKRKEEELKKWDVRLAVALDANTGEKLWEKPVNVTDCSYVGIGGGELTLMYHKEHVVICGANANGHYWRQFLSGQFDRRKLIVLDAETGKQLWQKDDANYRHRPIIVEDQIIAEPWSFDLATGKEKLRENPLTGQETKWQFSRPGHHCGMITATPNTLFFRSGFTGYYDLYSDSGVTHFAGQRMGCWVNAIPGNGLLMVPEASAGCVCQFSIASTIVMEPREDRDSWKIASLTGAATPVKQMSINLGAPGDRRDEFGTLWLAYPRPKTVGRLEYTFDLNASLSKGGDYYNRNSEGIDIANANTSWVLTSGARGLNRCELPLLGEDDEPASYAVTLHFAELDARVEEGTPFDIKLQGKIVSKSVDVAADAGGANRALTQEFNGLNVERNLVIELIPRGNNLPALSGIEVRRE